MAPSGGSTTIYGILYQVLGALGSVLKHHIAGDKVSIILEPSNGGDSQIHSRQAVIVEQWKSMDGGGTWSFNDFAGKVAHDLYRAVPERDSLERCDKDYKFVLRTEARIGAWKPAYDFFKTKLRPLDPSENVSDALRALGEERYETGSRTKALLNEKKRPEPIPVSGVEERDATKGEVCLPKATPTELFKTLMEGVRAGHALARKETDEVVLEKL